MNTPTTIIVHPGKAHRDDFLTVCLLLAKYGIEMNVYRRDPTQEELCNELIIVADVGGELRPMYRNYDHHQLLDKYGQPAVSSALQLVVQHELDMTEEFNEFKWFKFTTWMDSQGPAKTATEFGMAEFPWAASSPIENALIKLFEKEMVVPRHIKVIMLGIGENIIMHASEYKKGIEHCDELTLQVGHPELCGLLMLDKHHVKYLNALREKKYPEAVFSITKDDRGDGYCLYRYDDCPVLDFSKVAENREVEFAHAGGFIAKTLPGLTLGDLLDLVHQANVKE